MLWSVCLKIVSGDGRWDIGGDDTYRITLWKSLSQDSNLGLESKCRGRDGRALRDEFGKFTTCEIDNLFVAMIGWDEQKNKFRESLEFLRQRFASTKAKWRVCMWHRPEGAYQGRGGQDQDQGRLEAYDICRQGGAVIYTGHAHNYHRSTLMSNFKQKTISARHQDNNLALSCGPNGESFAVNTGIGGRSMTGTNYRFKHTVEEFSGDRARALGIHPDSRGAVICDLGKDTATCALSVIQPDGKVHSKVDPWVMTSSCGSSTPTTPYPTTKSPTKRPTSPTRKPTSSTRQPTMPTRAPVTAPSSPTPPVTPPSPSVTGGEEIDEEINPVCNQGDGAYAVNNAGGWIRPQAEYVYLDAPTALANTESAAVWVTITYLHPTDREKLPEFWVEHNSKGNAYQKAVVGYTERIDDPAPPQGDYRYRAYIQLDSPQFQNLQNCNADLRIADAGGMRVESVRMTNVQPEKFVKAQDQEQEQTGLQIDSVVIICAGAAALACVAAIVVVSKRNSQRAGNKYQVKNYHP